MGIVIILFATAAGVPLMLLAGGGLGVAGWAWFALGWITLLAFALDEVIGRVTPASDADAAPWPANLLSVALALGHLLVLVLVVRALAATGAGAAGPGTRLALFFAAGLWFGQVSNANAHELIHRPQRGLFWLGVAVYASLLFGHHASAHRLVHHVHVGTRRDPNTARGRESFYRFAPRAWIGSFRAGLAAETARRARAGRRAGLHPYAIYLGGAALALAIAWGLGGARGVGVYIALAGYAQTQLLLSDYVQHYGLRRATGADGRPEPVSPAHSWNAPHWFTSLMMLNAPRHSDHHAHPARPYPALRMPAPGEAPILPHSLPAMAALALFPARWRRVMERELARWRAAR